MSSTLIGVSPTISADPLARSILTDDFSRSIVPQIILNVQRGTARQSLTTEFIVGTTFARLILPVYFYGYSDNILDVDVSRESRTLILSSSFSLTTHSFIQLGSTSSSSTLPSKRSSSSSNHVLPSEPVSSSPNETSTCSTSLKFIRGTTTNPSPNRNSSISKRLSAKKETRKILVLRVRSAWTRYRFERRNQRSINWVQSSRMNESGKLTR